MHGLRSARARANLSGTSSHSLRKERGIFADKKQLSGSSLAHVQLRSLKILVVLVLKV